MELSVIDQFYRNNGGVSEEQVTDILKNRLTMFTFSHTHIPLASIRKHFKFRSPCEIEITGIEISSLSSGNFGVTVNLGNGRVYPFSCRGGYCFIDLTLNRNEDEIIVNEGELFEIIISPDNPIYMLTGKIFALRT